MGVLIGDVMGRGLEAAAVMGQPRSAAHALVKTGVQPRQLMRTLESLVGDLDVPDQLVTRCYLVIAADTGEVTMCSGGHLPVLVTAPGRGVTMLPAPVNASLGVGGVIYEQRRITVRARRHPRAVHGRPRSAAGPRARRRLGRTARRRGQDDLVQPGAVRPAHAPAARRDDRGGRRCCVRTWSTASRTGTYSTPRGIFEE